MTDFAQALAQYRRLVIDMDGDGIPDRAMMPPLPSQKPMHPQDEEALMQQYGSALMGYPAPFGPPQLPQQTPQISSPQQALPYDPTPNTPYSNTDHIVALSSFAGRSLIPGGSRLAANAQAYMSGTDDALDRLGQMNASDDALFTDYPIQTTAANMAGLAVPVMGAGRIVGKLAERATHVPAIAGALNTIPGMAAIGVGMGVSDEMIDRPDDGDPGLAAVVGGATGLLAGAGKSAAGYARRKFFPNRFEVEDDAWKEIEKLNQARRLEEYKSIARGPSPDGPKTPTTGPNPTAPPTQSSTGGNRLKDVADSVDLQSARNLPRGMPDQQRNNWTRSSQSASATPSAGFDGEVARLFGTVNPDTMARLAAEPALARRQAEIMARTAIQNQTGQSIRQAPPDAVEAAMRVLEQMIRGAGQ